MKLSIETKVASVVAAGFLAVTVGGVARVSGEAAARAPDNYGITNNPGVNTYLIQQEHDSSPLNGMRLGTGPVKLSLGKNVDGPAGSPALRHFRTELTVADASADFHF
jgi:hypothetical protein